MKPVKAEKTNDDVQYHARLAGLLNADADAVERLSYEVDVGEAEAGSSIHVRLAVALADAGYGPGDL